ncbi:hypothetical protein HDV00_011350, partial [Rhizophlyctis rosea]
PEEDPYASDFDANTQSYNCSYCDSPPYKTQGGFRRHMEREHGFGVVDSDSADYN